jgi:uncharacterized membrane protein
LTACGRYPAWCEPESRALHAIGFESGFIIIGVTAVALVLGVSLMQAFMLEIGFMLFFLPYTMAV